MVWNCFLNNQPVPIPKKVGRKTKKTATTVSIVKQYVFADPLISCKEISSLLKINYNLELSPTIIGEILRANKFHGDLKKVAQQFHTRRIDLLKERMRGRPKNRVRINRRPAEYKVPEGDDDDEDYEVLSDEEDSPDDEVHITKDDFCKTDKEFEEYSAYVSASTSVPPSSDREASSDDWSTSDYDYD